MDNLLLINTQLSHAESQAHLPKAFRPRSVRPGRQTLILLAVCMALQMTSFVLIQPLFARRFTQLGAGVQSLGESAMAYALAATLAAPFLGALADRIGRRWVVLASLGVYILTFTGYLLAASAGWFILLRGLAGAFTAGLVPAITGIVAEIAPLDRRAQWIGIVNGGASIGWIAGPILGGALYDRWGYALAVGVSIGLAALTFIVACLILPETHTLSSQPMDKARSKGFLRGFRGSLPASLPAFSLLLWIYFAVMFAYAFIDPRLQFYAYNDLGWTSSKLGLAMSFYGLSLALGEFGLSRLSDRLGRKPIILLGLVLFSAQFLGLALFRDYLWIAAAFLVAGLGNALYDPAISASILDLAPAGHQARLLGLKSTAGSLGNILGPGLLVLFTSRVSARGIFLFSAGVSLLTACLLLAGKWPLQSNKETLKQVDQAKAFSLKKGEIEP